MFDEEYEESISIDVLLPVHLIPDGSIVRKPTGEKPYTLAHEMRFFIDKDISFDVENVRADKDVCFLVSGNDVNIISSLKILKWRTTIEELCCAFNYDAYPMDNK